MKKSVLFILIFSFVLFLPCSYASNNLKTFTGKITAIDPQGRAVVASEMIGKTEMVVGVIVTPETEVIVGQKKGSLKDIKVGDRVTITYERTNDLYAKKIVKK